MRILLSNDDGAYAPGLRAMYAALRELGEPVIAAPAEEQSGVGHSITLKAPLLVETLYDDGHHIGWAIEGSPADCVKLGCQELIKPPPEIVVSGINAGANVGINVLYSGTVAAAIEGAFFGLTSFAVSLEYSRRPAFKEAAAIAVRLIGQILTLQPPAGSLFNINIPDLEQVGAPAGVRVVRQSTSRFLERFERRVDPRGRTYFWPSPELEIPGDPEDTDVAALAAGYVTITPLRFDLTAYESFQECQRWQALLEQAVPHAAE